MYVVVAEGGGPGPAFEDIPDGLSAVLPKDDAQRGEECDERGIVTLTLTLTKTITLTMTLTLTLTKTITKMKRNTDGRDSHGWGKVGKEITEKRYGRWLIPFFVSQRSSSARLLPEGRKKAQKVGCA